MSALILAPETLLSSGGKSPVPPRALRQFQASIKTNNPGATPNIDPRCIQFRTHVRDLALTPKFKRYLAKRIFDAESGDKVLIEVMRIAAGRTDLEHLTATTSNLNYTLIQSFNTLSPDALTRYAETGALDAASWTTDVMPSSHPADRDAAHDAQTLAIGAGATTDAPDATQYQTAAEGTTEASPDDQATSTPTTAREAEAPR